MLVLGINAFHGDASACLVDDGKIIAAVAEERFKRDKHEGGFPLNAVQWCINQTPKKIEHVAVSRNPGLFLGKKIYALARYPGLLRRFSDRKFNRKQLYSVNQLIENKIGHPVEISPVEHHLAHLTYGYVTSNFERCSLLSIDGFGDFVSTAWGEGINGKINVSNRIFFPHSLGIFYTALTQFLGFDGYGEEYKVMALASYGAPHYKGILQEIIFNTNNGFKLAPKYFTHTSGGGEMTYGAGTPKLGRLYSNDLVKILGPARKREQPLTARHFDIAASLQAVATDLVLHLGKLIRNHSESKNLVLSGGVAQNSVTNGALEQSALFEKIWFPSAPADDGTAIGAAAVVALANGDSFVGKNNSSPFLGPQYGTDQNGDGELINNVVQLLKKGKIIGWFEGRAEFGPRALGHRSILADPRTVEMKDKINAIVKKRENFRPFAPMVLLEDANKYFNIISESPNMMSVVTVKPEWRQKLAAISHVDGTARVQTVTGGLLPNIARLLEAWRDAVGISVLLNTSFNENEPIVNTPEEAIACFNRTRLDALVINGKLFVK